MKEYITKKEATNMIYRIHDSIEYGIHTAVSRIKIKYIRITIYAFLLFGIFMFAMRDFFLGIVVVLNCGIMMIYIRKMERISKDCNDV